MLHSNHPLEKSGGNAAYFRKIWKRSIVLFIHYKQPVARRLTCLYSFIDCRRVTWHPSVLRLMSDGFAFPCLRFSHTEIVAVIHAWHRILVLTAKSLTICDGVFRGKGKLTTNITQLVINIGMALSLTATCPSSIGFLNIQESQSYQSRYKNV